MTVKAKSVISVIVFSGTSSIPKTTFGETIT